MYLVTLVRRHGFLLKLGLLALLVCLGDWMFWQREYGVGNLGLYGIALLIALVGVRPVSLASLAGKLSVGAVALYAVAIFLDTRLLSLALFWVAISVVALLPFSSKLKDGWQWFWRLALHSLVAWVKPFNDAARLKRVGSRRGTRATKFNARAAFSLLALPVIGGVAFFGLFVQANPILEKLVATWRLPAFDGQLMLRAILWTIASLLIWSLFQPWRRKGGAQPNPALSVVDMQTPAAIPLPSLASITLSLLVFNGLFLMQNSMDLAFLTGLVPLPDTMTLAQYAHRGAYPLIGTALLAGLFVLILLQPGSVAANNKLARILVVIWIVQNVALVASSMLRTWDYVEVYSLTKLRIAALVWMALVGVGLALICWRLLRDKSASWLINANLWAAGLVLTTFCFVDTGAIAARWNVVHAKEVGGRGAQLDLCHFETLGSGAILPLMSLEARPLAMPFLRKVTATRLQIQAVAQSNLENGGWTWLLQRRLQQAVKRAATLPAIPPQMDWYACSGSLSTYSSDEIPFTPQEAPTIDASPELTPQVTP